MSGRLRLHLWHCGRFLDKDILLGSLLAFFAVDLLWLAFGSLLFAQTSLLSDVYPQIKAVSLLLLILSITIVFLAFFYASHQNKAAQRMFAGMYIATDAQGLYHSPYQEWMILPVPLSRKVLLLRARIPVADALNCCMTDEDLAVLGALLRDETGSTTGVPS